MDALDKNMILGDMDFLTPVQGACLCLVSQTSSALFHGKYQ